MESTKTFTGKNKELYFKNNKQNFKKYLDKIIHVVVDEKPYYNPRANEELQIKYIGEEIDKLDLNLNDLIINSDCDEIINIDILKKIRSKEILIKNACTLVIDEYYYNLNYKTNTKWNLPKIYSYKEFITYNINQRETNHLPEINNAGWQFSYFGDITFIKNKINAFSHQEFNKEEFKNDNHLKNAIE